MKRSDPDLTSTLKPFIKTKWYDTAYFISQVRGSGKQHWSNVNSYTERVFDGRITVTVPRRESM